MKDLVVGSGLRFAERGEHELKGVPGVWRLYALAEDGPRGDGTIGGPQPTAGDRAAVRIARRAPGALRAVGRIAQRRSSS